MIEDKKHLNKRCFVIGGGESIKFLIDNGLDIAKLFVNEITIGTNKSYLLGRSTYHVVMDFDYFNKDKENLIKQNLYVSDNIWNNAHDLSLKPIKRLGRTPNIISKSFQDGFYYGKSTGYLAMNLANVLGCNPIYLLGIDLMGLHFHVGYGAIKDQRLPKEHRIIENEFRVGIEFLIKSGKKIISLSDCSRLNDIIPFDPSILRKYGYNGVKSTGLE